MKTVLITGGSRGIGRALTEKFSKEGYTVFFTYNKNDEAAEEVSKKTGAYAFRCDVSDSGSVEKLGEDIKALGVGRLDCLVNNAGIAQQKLFCDLTESDWDRMFNVNIKGMFLTAKKFVPEMIRAAKGSIVNVSSVWGLSGGSCEVHYAASKAAVIGFTRALSDELAPSGIRVNCVAPGVINTAMNAHLSESDIAALAEETPLGRTGTPEEIADVIFYLSDSASFITGEVIKASGGF